MNSFYDLLGTPEYLVTKIIPYLPLLLLIAGYYFLILRPQKQTQLQFEKMVEAIEIGQRLVTNGGMVGVVVEILPASLILSLYDGAKVEILKEAIVSILHE